MQKVFVFEVNVGIVCEYQFQNLPRVNDTLRYNYQTFNVVGIEYVIDENTIFIQVI